MIMNEFAKILLTRSNDAAGMILPCRSAPVDH
jgi:hypothetical protein